MREVADWIKQGLSDNETGKPSFGRMSCAFVLYALVCWETYLVSKHAAFHEIPANWLILVLAIWTVASAKETMNKHIDASVVKSSDSVAIARSVAANPLGTGNVDVNVGGADGTGTNQAGSGQ